MNPFDFTKIAHNGDMIMPLLIFIIWLVFSGMTKSKAKKKRMSGSTAPARKKTGILDEIRRQYEVVLAEQHKEKLPPQPEPAPRPMETADLPEEQSLEEVAVEEQSYEREFPVAGPKPKEEAKPTVTVSPPLPALIEPGSISSSAITDSPSTEGEKWAVVPGDFNSLEEARRGFVWSEILAPPVSLREGR